MAAFIRVHSLGVRDSFLGACMGVWGPLAPIIDVVFGRASYLNGVLVR